MVMLARQCERTGRSRTGQVPILKMANFVMCSYHDHSKNFPKTASQIPGGRHADPGVTRGTSASLLSLCATGHAARPCPFRSPASACPPATCGPGLRGLVLPAALFPPSVWLLDSHRCPQSPTSLSPPGPLLPLRPRLPLSGVAATTRGRPNSFCYEKEIAYRLRQRTQGKRNWPPAGYSGDGASAGLTRGSKDVPRPRGFPVPAPLGLPRALSLFSGSFLPGPWWWDEVSVSFPATPKSPRLFGALLGTPLGRSRCPG